MGIGTVLRMGCGASSKKYSQSGVILGMEPAVTVSESTSNSDSRPESGKSKSSLPKEGQSAQPCKSKSALPMGSQSAVDQATGKTYYYKPGTDIVQWEPPRDDDAESGKSKSSLPKEG